MLVVTLCFCYAIYYLWQRYQRAFKDSPKIVPLFKCIKIAFKNVDLWCKAIYVCELVSEAGGVARGYFYGRGFRTLYVVTDPEDAMTALKACTEKDPVYQLWKPWLGEAAFIGSAQVNKLHRKLFMKVLMPSNMEAFMGYFNQHSKRLVQKLFSLAGTGPLDLSRLLRLYNLELLCDTMLALDDFEQVNFEAYLDAVSNFIKITAHRFDSVYLQVDTFFQWSKLKNKHDEAIEILHQTSNQIIKYRRQKLKEIKENKSEKLGHEVLLDVLLEAVDNGVISEEAMKAEVNGTIFAGHDTSAYTLLYALILLGSYSEVQKRAYEEVKNILGERTAVTKDDLVRMVYVEAVIKESMRIYPYIMFLPRLVTEDIKLKNCTLSPGSCMAVSTYTVHRHKSWGPDAEEFRPDRWLEPDKLPKPAVLLGFSEGARNCTGRRYAMISIKVLFVHLLRSFKFTADHNALQFEFLGVMEPKAGHHVSIERRTLQEF